MKYLIYFIILLLLTSVSVYADSDSRTVTAAVLCDFPPLYSLDDDGNPEGFAIDLLEHVATHAGFTIEYIQVENWSAAMQAVRDGRADLIPGIGISDTRKAEFAFTEVIETIPVSCFVRSNNASIKGLDSLSKGHKTAVINQSAAMSWLKDTPGINMVGFDNIDSAFFQLLAGDIDVFVFPEPVLWKKVRQVGMEDTVKVVGEPVMELKRGFLLSKNNEELLKMLNSEIQIITSSQEYMVAYKKWYGAPVPFWTVQRILYAMSIVWIGVIVIIVIWRFLSMSRLNNQLVENLELREMNEEVRQQLMRTMDAKNKELENIVYVSSHDLRSPIVNLQGHSGQLNKSCKKLLTLIDGVDCDPDIKKKISYLSSEDIPESLGFIQAASKKMGALIKGLLQVSRAGSVEISIEPLDFNKTVSEIIEAMSYTLQQNSIEIIKGDLPGCVGDANQINQLFTNLIDNAIKYRHSDRPCRIKITAKSGKNGCIYCVEDNGIGIKNDHVDKIFELYHRLDPDHAEGGEGLGLSIIMRILDRHNGSISVESEPDVGSKFYVTLPCSLANCLCSASLASE